MFIARIIPHGLFPICGESPSTMRRLSGNQREFSVNATGIRRQPDGAVAMGFVSNQERIKPRTLFYHYFPSKDELTSAVLNTYVGEFVEALLLAPTVANALWSKGGYMRSLDLLVFPWGGGLAWLQLDEASVSCMKALLCWACVVYHRRNHLTEGDFHG